MQPTILIIDDDPTVAKSLELLLRRGGYTSQSVSRMSEAMPAMRKFRPAVVLLDMNFRVDTSGRDGMKLLGDILAEFPEQPVIQMTGWATVQLAVEGMKAGAKDFIAKPWDNRELLNSIATQIERHGTRAQTGEDAGASRSSKEQGIKGGPFSNIIGESPGLVSILQQARRVAPTQAPVLITGESGTGKELVAEAIHAASKRSDGPFVAVNLGGVPVGLFESELFGHKKGAFTDAKTDRKGYFELAKGGTLFLDEIGDLAASAQVKLLRVLQQREYQRLGDSTLRKTDVRILSATSRNLASLVTAGTFREDLLYRINLIHLELPALRRRPTDVPLLAEHFLAGARRRYGRPELSWSSDALSWLRRGTFPGNIRQLQNLVERTAILAPGPIIEPDELAQHLGKGRATVAGDLSGVTIKDMEIRMIRAALARNGNEITATARELGLTRAALYRRLEKFDIEF